MNPESPAALAAFKQAQQDNPNLKAMIGPGVESLALQGMRFFAVGHGNPGHPGSDVNVIVRPALGFQNSDLAQIASAAPAEYARLGATVVGTHMITFDHHEALKTSIRQPLTDSLGRHVILDQTQYFVGLNNFLYTISFTGSSPEIAEIAMSFHTQ